MNTTAIPYSRLLSLPIRNDGTPILAVDVMTDRERLWFYGDADIDFDGSGGNPEHDPTFQPDTTLHHDGAAINPFKVKGVVLPPAIIDAVAPRVLGCFARVTYRRTGKSEFAVVHDVGPRNKVGEITPCLAQALGMNPHNNGGEDDYSMVLYEVWPGVPAVIDGVFYNLQSHK